MLNVFVGIDIGGTSIKGGVLSINGNILFRTQSKTQFDCTNQEFINQVWNIIDLCISSSPKKSNILCVGIGSPGPISITKGIVLSSANLPNVKKCALISSIKKRIDIHKYNIPILFNNDANCAALGNFYFGTAKKYINSATITLGTGVGGGLILNKKLFNGYEGNAFEVGHISIANTEFGKPSYYVKCGCGKYGCIETYASATAVSKIYKYLNKKDDLTAIEIFNLAKQENKFALETFKIVGEALGILSSQIIQTLNLPFIIFTGGLVNAAIFIQPTLIKTIQEKTLPELIKKTKIQFTVGKKDLGILGAAALYLNEKTI